MGVLSKLQRWWQGDADPQARAEAAEVAEQRDTIRASVPGSNFWGGMHRRDVDVDGRDKTSQS